MYTACNANCPSVFIFTSSPPLPEMHPHWNTLHHDELSSNVAEVWGTEGNPLGDTLTLSICLLGHMKMMMVMVVVMTSDFVMVVCSQIVIWALRCLENEIQSSPEQFLALKWLRSWKPFLVNIMKLSKKFPTIIKWNSNHADSKGAWFEFLPFATELPPQRLSLQDQTLSSAKSAKSSSGEEEKEMQIRNWGEPVFLAEMQTEFQRRNASRGAGWHFNSGVRVRGGLQLKIFVLHFCGSYKKFCREAKSSKVKLCITSSLKKKTSTLKRWQLSCIFTPSPLYSRARCTNAHKVQMQMKNKVQSANSPPLFDKEDRAAVNFLNRPRCSLVVNLKLKLGSAELKRWKLNFFENCWMEPESPANYPINLILNMFNLYNCA